MLYEVKGHDIVTVDLTSDVNAAISLYLTETSKYSLYRLDTSNGTKTRMILK